MHGIIILPNVNQCLTAYKQIFEPCYCSTTLKLPNILIKNLEAAFEAFSYYNVACLNQICVVKRCKNDSGVNEYIKRFL